MESCLLAVLCEHFSDEKEGTQQLVGKRKKMEIMCVYTCRVETMKMTQNNIEHCNNLGEFYRIERKINVHSEASVISMIRNPT